jgi:hypothetical protein
LCSRFNEADHITFNLGGNIFYGHVARKSEATGTIWLHAAEVCDQLVRSIFVAEGYDRFVARLAKTHKTDRND